MKSPPKKRCKRIDLIDTFRQAAGDDGGDGGDNGGRTPPNTTQAGQTGPSQSP